MNTAILRYDRATALDAIGPDEALQSLPGATVRFVAKQLGSQQTGAGTPALVAGHALVVRAAARQPNSYTA